MVQRHPTSPLDPEPDDGMSFTDVTVLAFLAVAVPAVLVLLLLGAVSAEHRIAAVLGLV